MKTSIFSIFLVALLAATPAMAQADFTTYVALGDSLTAGFASGSLMDWYQDRSYPALISDLVAGTSFEQPLVSEPGFGPIFELVQLAPDPVIAPVGEEPGLPVNATLPRPYNNLGVPGATLYNMIFTAGDINNLLQGNYDNVMHDLILRDGTYTALEQGIGMAPTFMTVWIGNDDVLTAVLAATPIDGVTMTPVEFFAGLYNNAIGALVTNTAADIVLINLPYSTEIPFVNSLEPFVDIPDLGRWYLEADTGPLTDDDLVTLSAGELIAMGYGLPGGPPLPDDMNVLTGEPGYVLRADEVETINERIDDLNAAIADVAATFGLPVFDANAFFHEIASGETTPYFAGATLSADFLLGGIFSYDGVHPQNIGYALFADELVQFINTTFGNSIPRVDMGQVLYEGDWQNPGVSPAKAAKVVFSKEAFDRLYKLFPPKLERAPRIRRPNVDRPGLPGADVRRAPISRN
jgi:lysophospholipase L1-like esterase